MAYHNLQVVLSYLIFYIREKKGTICRRAYHYSIKIFIIIFSSESQIAGTALPTMDPMGPLGSTIGWINNQKWAPARCPRQHTPNYPTDWIARGRGGVLMPLSYEASHRTIQARRSSRVLETYAWAERAVHTLPFLDPRSRCVQMLIMLMGRRLSLSVMRGLNRETLLRCASFVFFLFLIEVPSIFSCGTPSAALLRSLRTKGTDPAYLETPRWTVLILA